VPVPTRRILETTLLAIALARPVFGTCRLWAVKTMQNTSPGTPMHVVAEIVAVLT
jgi:hypothetical protein